MSVRILLAEPSEVIRIGIAAILKKISNVHVEITEVVDMRQLKEFISGQKFDLLVVNPVFSQVTAMRQLKQDALNPLMKCIALRTVLTDNTCFQGCDEVLSIFDSASSITEKMNKVIAAPEKERVTGLLSDREKEIVGCIAKGLSNKEIADVLHLSVHTVVTHRRNISGKLNIHSPSGLTIYAIVNKLVDIDDIDGE